MKRNLLFAVLLLYNLAFSASKISVYHEEVFDGTNIYVDNPFFCEVSVQLNLDLQNMKSRSTSNLYLVPSKANRYLITKLTPINRGQPSQFNYVYKSSLGNHALKDYDVHYVYHLPFENNNKFYLSQGYNGRYSHQKENSLDFVMPIGTPILAVKKGIVIDIMDLYKKGCLEKMCEDFANFILIRHDDGTFAQYVHLKYKGVVVKEGAKVNEGQKIGYSGNTGWSSEPHLHLTIFLQRLNKRETLKTRFLLNKSGANGFLKEGNYYNKNY